MFLVELVIIDLVLVVIVLVIGNKLNLGYVGVLFFIVSLFSLELIKEEDKLWLVVNVLEGVKCIGCVIGIVVIFEI